MSETSYNWLVDRQPTQNRYTVVGDVTGSIEVSMEFKRVLCNCSILSNGL